MNAFESGDRKLIPAVLVYGRRAGEILFLHRHPDFPANRGSVHSGKWNGLGGKLEPGESFREAARREFREESGIDLPEESFRIRGFLHFPGFQPHKNQDWLVHVFEAAVPGDALPSLKKECPEGVLSWVPEEKALSLDCWEGDRHFLPLLLEEGVFEGTLWYRELRLEKASVRLL